LSRNASVDPQLSVFLARDAAKPEIAAVEARLKGARGVSAVRFVSRDAALVELNRVAGMQEVIASLPQNPLPDAFVVTLFGSDPALADRLELEFKSLPKVAYVQADSAWVRRLDALLRLGRTAVVLLSALLGLALMAVTFQHHPPADTHSARRDRAVPSDRRNARLYPPALFLSRFTARPVRGIAALAIVLSGLTVLNRDLADLAYLYGSNIRLRFPNPNEMISALLAAVALGWLGAYLSVSRHLLETDRD